MRVQDLLVDAGALDALKGRRIRVIRVAVGEAERLGYVDDSRRLTGKEGTVTGGHVASHGMLGAQLWVAWDDKTQDGPGSLCLTSDDEVEVI